MRHPASLGALYPNPQWTGYPKYCNFPNGMPWVPKSDREEAQPCWAAQGMHHGWGCRPQARMAGRVGCPPPRCRRLCPPTLLIHRPLLLVVVGMGLGEWGAADGARCGMSGGGRREPTQTGSGRQAFTRTTPSLPTLRAGSAVPTDFTYDTQIYRYIG